MAFKLFFIFFVSILTFGCERAIVRSVDEPEIRENLTQKRFIKDGRGGLFNNLKWYTYNMDNHVIYPHLDVFSIKAQGKIYLVQIFGYYHPNDSKLSGFISLRYREKGEPFKEVILDASACGNAYSNPDFENCQKDPAKNVFTYFDFRTGESFRVTDEESLRSTKWDIAFKTTNAKLNGGTSGPKNVVGGLLQRNYDFFDGRGKPDLQKIGEVLEIDKGFAIFEMVDENLIPFFYSPDGYDRVIFEKDWWETDLNFPQKKNPKVENWWILKSIEGNSYAKINITEIEQTEVGAQITLSFILQKSDETEFAEKAVQWKTPEISVRPGIKSLCFDFDEMVEEKCETGKKWDLKLVSFNKLEDNRITSDWRIFTRNEGYGPLKIEEMTKITFEKGK